MGEYGYDWSVRLVEQDEYGWDYRSSYPKFSTPHQVELDPFPCYAHDVSLVKTQLQSVMNVFPPETDLKVFVLKNEETARTNGHSDRVDIEWYRRDSGPSVMKNWTGVIVLGGKRIPPHPAMTRYLVAHEYGHHVEYWLQRRMDIGDREMDHLYAAIRPGVAPVYGSGGRWHNAVGEVLACDFRVLVAGVERDYWPHPGVPRPEEVPAVQAWWRMACEMGPLELSEAA